MERSDTARVALITGCGKRNGMGAGLARALASRGMAVAVTDVVPTGVPNLAERSEDVDQSWHGLEQLTREIQESGANALAVVGDVGKEADVSRMVGQTLSHYGRVDVLVNCAAAPQGPEWNDIEKIPFADWKRVMEITTVAPSSRRTSAITRPIPRLPPVTTATRPARPRSTPAYPLGRPVRVCCRARYVSTAYQPRRPSFDAV